MRNLAMVALLTCAFAYGGDLPLRMDGGSWTPNLSEGAQFTAVKDAEKGPALVVGSARAGRVARYQYNEAIPVLDGQVSGWYRTRALLPRTAAVFISFPIAGVQPRTQTFHLAPSAGWSRFSVPIRRPPPGARAVQIAVGLSELAEGEAVFARLTISSEPFRVEFPKDPGRITRPAPPAKLAARGFYRVAQANGAWWLVTPQGRPFYSTGTDGRRFETEAEGRQSLGVMRKLGFNSLGGWSSLETWGPLNDREEAPLAAFRSLQTSRMEGEYDRLTPGNHAFPDPFDPRWEAVLRAHVRRVAAPVRGKSWFVGFFADNEITHRDLHRHVYTPNSAAALRAFLEKRYGTIARLNAAWGAAYESFEALIAGKPDPAVRHGAMYQDFRLFTREIVRRYVDTVIRIVHEEDPGHLVLSNRFMLDDMHEWMEVLDLYKPFDVIAVNIYPANLSAGLNAGERAIFELVHQKTGRPIIVPEWSVPALDSGLYNNPNKLDWSYREVVDTQQQRARQAATITISFFNLPHVVGAHWFTWKDVNTDVRQANRGLFQSSGEPWTDLQDGLAAVNRRIEKWGQPDLRQ